MLHTPVLIVGGSLVGLSAALFLAHHQIDHILIEKHSGRLPHPRAMGFIPLTLEHYRMVGIADHIEQTSPNIRLKRIAVESLTGAWKQPQAWTPNEDEAATHAYMQTLSPCTGAAIAQDKLEPILQAEAIKRGSQIHHHHELIRLTEQADGVVAEVFNHATQSTMFIHAQYIIAADGANSPIRQTLGIKQQGVGHLCDMHSILFDCPQADSYLERGYQQFSIEQADFSGFLTTYGDSRWVLMYDDKQTIAHLSPEQLIQKALGKALPFKIITTGKWEMAGRIATNYQKGRVFLVGDSAHQLPPTRGGFGANTGIDDAWNLTWKLAWVLKAKAHPDLLNTYDAERQPIGWLRHQQTFSRPDYQQRANHNVAEPILSSEAMEFGQLVRSTAIVGTDVSLPMAQEVDKWQLQAGTRMPHVWLKSNPLEESSDVLSTLDFLGKDFVLISNDTVWLNTAKQHHLATLDLTAYHLVPSPQHEALIQKLQHSTLLVRPDGIIAWQATSRDNPSSTLHKVLRGIYQERSC